MALALWVGHCVFSAVMIVVEGLQGPASELVCLSVTSHAAWRRDE